MFPYFGNKYAKAKRYPAPSHGTIVEPFAGGAGYGIYWLERIENVELVVVESDPIVCGLWRRMLEPDAATKIRALPDVKAGDRCRDPLTSLSLYRNGHLGKSGSESGFKVLPGVENRWPALRDRIAARSERLADRVTLIEGDYTLAPDAVATWFIDPPYQRQAKNAYAGEPLDYDKLSSWCRRRQGQSIVCEGEGADWLPFTVNHTVMRRSGSPKGSKPSTYAERVWLNPPGQRGTLEEGIPDGNDN